MDHQNQPNESATKQEQEQPSNAQLDSHVNIVADGNIVQDGNIEVQNQ